jgi:DNA-directed RNA polymerase
MTETEKKEIQFARERSTVIKAIERLKEQVDAAPGYSPAGRRLAQQTLKKLSNAIAAEQEALFTNRSQTKEGQLDDDVRKGQEPERRLGKYERRMLCLHADVLAVITLGVLLNEVGGVATKDEMEAEGEGNFTAVARQIGYRCQIQWFRTPFSEKNDAINKIAARAKTPDAKARAKLRVAETLNSDWTEKEGDFQIGDTLLKCASDVKLIAVSRGTTENKKNFAPRTVSFTSETRAELQWGKHLVSCARPFHLPMVFRPNPWLTLEGGGYLCNEEEKRIHLVKHWNNPKIKEGLKEGDNLVSRLAVNALQETRWRINKQVYACMLNLQELGSKTKVPVEMREKLDLKLGICADLSGEERLYFPYQLDFRGRAYCIPPLVNPQGDDIGRSLLEFADGFPLGADGVKWLEIHLANSYGEEKGCFNARRQWTRKHSKKIVMCANFPFGNRWWWKADKQWRFLAACFLWRTYQSQGENSISHLPITVDGTCNGFQHMSALLLNSSAAASTNLAPNDSPRDFYGEVAALLRATLEREAKKGIVGAKDWLENVEVIDRKLVKPAVMATPYGIGRDSIKENLLGEKISKRLSAPELSCDYMARKLKACIRVKFPEPYTLTKWLKKIARDLASRTDPLGPQGIRWTTPSGFTVVHERWQGKKRLITSCFGKQVIYDPDQPDSLLEDEQVTGVVPNFIHSLDAAHLALTVKKLHEEGVVNVGVIHDGYSVHAHQVDHLMRVLRDEFVKMYQKHPLRSLAFELGCQAIPKHIDDPPKLGDFDIELVRQSEYFFC